LELRGLLRRVSFPSYLSVALVAIVYVGTLCILEKRAFWVVDNANKFLQLQSIVQSQYSDYSIPWPGQPIDPELEYHPFEARFAVVKDGRLFPIFSPVFALVSSIPFRLFGFWGLYLLPLAASVFSLVAVARSTEHLNVYGAGRHTAVLLVGLATPLWFYSVVFWEHTIALCLCMWGLYFFLKWLRTESPRSLVAGSVLVALAAYFRDDLYVLCLVILIAVVLSSRARKIRAGLVVLGTTIAGLAPLWLLQWRVTGEPFGFHLGTHASFVSGLSEHLAQRPTVFYSLLVAAFPNVWVSLAISAMFVLLFVWNPKLSGRTFAVIVPVCCLVALIGAIFSLGGYVVTNKPLMWMFRSNGLFAAAPFLILGLVRYKGVQQPGDADRAARWLWLVALGFTIAYGLAAPELGTTGIHWGSRLLLLLYPVLGMLAARNLSHWFGATTNRLSLGSVLIVGTIAVSLVAQCQSIRLLHQKKAFSHRLNQAIQALPEQVLITDRWWAPQELFSQFFDKAVFYIHHQQPGEPLRRKLLAHGYRQGLFVTHPGRFPPAAAVATLEDEKLNCYSLQFTRIRLDR